MLRRRPRLDETEQRRLAAEGRAFLTQYRHFGRQFVLMGRRPAFTGSQIYSDRVQAESMADQLGLVVVPVPPRIPDPERFAFCIARMESSTDEERLDTLQRNRLLVREYILALPDQRERVVWNETLNDEDAFRIVRQNPRLAPFLASRFEKRLEEFAHTDEPDERNLVREAIERMASLLHPRPRGQTSEFDRDAVRFWYRSRMTRQRDAQSEYRKSGRVPPAHLLPVLDVGVRLTRRIVVGDRAWPGEATRSFLCSFLGIRRITLERLLRSA